MDVMSRVMLAPNVVTVVRLSEVEDPVEWIGRRWDGLRGDPAQLLFKPNLINHKHLSGGDYTAVVTQPEVLDLAWSVANHLRLSGPRAVADAPQADADFASILRFTGLDRWEHERGVTIVDLRGERYDDRNAVPITRHKLPGDPAGAVRVDLGRLSAFHGIEDRRYYGADYDIDYTNEHHRGDRHEYLFSGTALNSGIIINLPKLKTHKKAGVTLSLKNLVGLNADKNLLPHYTLGTPDQGGDAYPTSAAMRRFESNLLTSVKPFLARSPTASRAAARLKPAARRILGDTQEIVRSGNWWGNDTIWRMILDLNRILRYARPDGSLATTPQRATVSMIDGVVAGEGNGPEAPDPVHTGVVIAGTDFVAVDIVATTLMGVDFRRIPHLAKAIEPHPLSLTDARIEDLEVESNVPEWNGNLWKIDPRAMFRFRPHFGWAGRMERSNSSG